MDITFPDYAPNYDGNRFVLTFSAEAGTTRIECAITAEALEDHFGAASVRETDLHVAFAAHRATIERAAACLIDATRATSITLHSGYFRMYGDP